MARDRYDFMLESSGSTGGALPDVELKALLRCGATKRNINEAWLEFLAKEGFAEGALNDRMYAWLGSKGYKGTLSDRLYQLYQVTGGVDILCPSSPLPGGRGSFSKSFSRSFG